MPLVMNGTTIPENVANAFSFNGVNITQVVYNGVAVWKKSLNLLWSGNSLAAVGNATVNGFRTSNNLIRWEWGNGYVGAWITANANGTFTGDSIPLSSYEALRGSSNTLKWFTQMGAVGGLVTYLNKAFTGSSVIAAYGSCDEFGCTYQNIDTSGGLMRWRYGSTVGAPYISLT